MKTKLFSLSMMIYSLFSYSQVLDNAFGNNGKIILNDLKGYTTLTLQKDGKLLLPGTGFDNKPTLIRMNKNGSIDTSFGDSGKFKIDEIGIFREIIPMQDGSAVIRFVPHSNTQNYRLIKVKSNGTIDSAFNFVNIYNSDFSFGVLADGKIVTLRNDNWIFLHNQDGSLNSTFGNGGHVIIDANSTWASGILKTNPQTDDIFVMIKKGASNDIWKVNKNGVINPMPLTLNSSNVGPFEVKSGALYVSFIDPQNFDTVTRRIKSDFSSFENEYIWKRNNDFSHPYGIVVQNDGKVIQAHLKDPLVSDLQMVRFTTNAEVDTSFGISGKFNYNVNIGNLNQFDIEYNDIDDKIYGYVHSTATNTTAILKFSAGSLSVSQTSKNEKIFYPNPTRSLLHFTKEIKSAEIFSLDGRKVMSNIKGNSSDVSNLERGTYIIKGTDKEGQSFSQKVIKQ